MQKKIKILAIAPYAGLKSLIDNVAKECSELEVHTFVGNMLEGVEIVKSKNLNQYDLIISRAGTADLIKTMTDLPVIDIKLSILDMMRAIKLTHDYSGKFAVVGFRSITEQASLICQLNEYDIEIKTLTNISEINDSLNELKEKGISLIVGDVITTNHAKLFGLNSILVTSGVESVRNALSEAIQLHGYLLDAKKKNALVKKINEHLNVTVVSFDVERKVVYSNIGENEHANEILQMLKEQWDVLLKEKEMQVLKTVGESHFIIEGKMLSFEDEIYPTFYIQNQPLALKPFDKSITYKNVTDTPQVKFEAFPASNPTFKKMIEAAKIYSEAQTPILLCGDKGSGKNILAHAIYQNSHLRKNPMVIINAKYMNEMKWTSIFESDQSPFVNRGFTIYIRNMHFLNEKSQMVLESYLSNTYAHKRNRFLFSYINGYSSSFDNGTLLAFIRNDMSAFPLVIPNLNQRKEDIPSLVSIFLSELIPKYGKQILGLTQEAMVHLQEFHWTYNVEQLRKIIEELIIVSDDFYIGAETVESILANESLPKHGQKLSFIDLNKTLDEINRDVMEFVLSDENYNYSKASKRLGISRSTLWRRLK